MVGDVSTTLVSPRDMHAVSGVPSWCRGVVARATTVAAQPSGAMFRCYALTIRFPFRLAAFHDFPRPGNAPQIYDTRMNVSSIKVAQGMRSEVCHYQSQSSSYEMGFADRDGEKPTSKNRSVAGIGRPRSCRLPGHDHRAVFVVPCRAAVEHCCQIIKWTPGTGVSSVGSRLVESKDVSNGLLFLCSCPGNLCRHCMGLHWFHDEGSRIISKKDFPSVNAICGLSGV